MRSFLQLSVEKFSIKVSATACLIISYPLYLKMVTTIVMQSMTICFALFKNVGNHFLKNILHKFDKMYGIYIINRAGGLIYQYDHNMPKVEVEKTFSYPLELVLKIFDEKVVVDFGQRDGIKGNAPPPMAAILPHNQDA